MGIDRDAWHTKSIAQDHIGCLPADAGQRHQFLHGGRDLSAVLFHQLFAEANDVPRLVAEKTGGMDHLLQFARVGRGKGPRIRIAPEQSGRHQVHPLIGTLGRENGSDQKLERIGIVQSTVGLGISRGQGPEDSPHPIVQGVGSGHILLSVGKPIVHRG